ncbi:MAG TPA: ABC transporter permease subunit, partial [Patescibacteria group bacterium]|nr:ABC transporter permease subunit [Patescibacteria group bacterium]
MTFLPVVQRELRVAARKGSTFWLRVWAALAALLIGSAFLAICIITGTNSARFGPSLFGTLTWLALVTTIAAGLFFTADSLSEEKREGTLGFLFLTDLSGMDVVGGKLLATSLRGSYALLAIFPILGTTLLMGGVTGGQFWRSSLALVNALFYSLAVGLLVSALSRNSQHALAGTFFLLLFLCGVGPLIDSSLTTVRPSGVQPFFRYTSPAYVFWAATAWGRTGFWPALAISHLIAWANLVLSGFLVR